MEIYRIDIGLYKGYYIGKDVVFGNQIAAISKMLGRWNMQMDGRLKTLLSLLSEDEYIETDLIAKEMKLSQRTIRNLLGSLNELLKKNGAEIERRRSYGIRLSVHDRDIYQKFMKNRPLESYPQTAKDRFDLILSLFFSTFEYVKAEELCDRLYVSRKTLSIDLKNVELYLKRFHLELERKPYYGLKISGNEFSKRICISALFYERSDQWLQNIYSEFKDPELIRNAIMNSVACCGYTIYEMDISNIVLQIQIAIYRQSHGFVIQMEEITDSEFLKESDIYAARLCSNELEELFKIKFSLPEIKYIAIQLLGKKKVLEGDKTNVFIDMEINQLVNRMLETVKDAYGLDFSTDFNLNTLLRQHMVSLRIRLQYGLRMDNPILQEIKENYSFPYAVAAHASTVLSEYFHTIVPEAEIGFLALGFALAIKRQDTDCCQHNILLVCASGAGSAQLFEFRFREIFGKYLNRVETCDIASLQEKDFSEIDFVFSTVPIKAPIPVPVCQVQYFFDRHNVEEVERLLKHEKESCIKSYFDERLFFTDVKGNTREEVLHEICQQIQKIYSLSDDFEESVLKRENLMQTDFCPRIAIPHPYSPITDKTFVSVSILEKPIMWHRYEVQIVFLLSISKNKENLEQFYSIAPRFIMNERCIEYLLQTKCYETLMKLITWAEEGNI